MQSKKALTDFAGLDPIATRNENEIFLSDDVSFIIAHNKKTRDTLEICSLLSYTNVNVLPFSEDIPLEVIAFLDPTIEKLYFEQMEKKTFIHLKFKGEDEIILNNAMDLEQYLSSGTIKGIITFFPCQIPPPINGIAPYLPCRYPLAIFSSFLGENSVKA